MALKIFDPGQEGINIPYIARIKFGQCREASFLAVEVKSRVEVSIRFYFISLRLWFNYS